MIDFDDKKVLAMLADAAAYAAETRPMEVFNLCESPIEHRLLLGIWSFLCWPDKGELVTPTAFLSRLREAPTGKPVVAPQVVIGDYRIDIMIAMRSYDGEFYRLAVECDGHDFHEKTKRQAARDKARDRALVERNIAVLRFTGSEIHQAPSECAYQISSLVHAERANRLYAEYAAGLRRQAVSP